MKKLWKYLVNAVTIHERSRQRLQDRKLREEYTHGYDHGLDQGYSAGWEEGYNQGYEAADSWRSNHNLG